MRFGVPPCWAHQATPIAGQDEAELSCEARISGLKAISNQLFQHPLPFELGYDAMLLVKAWYTFLVPWYLMLLQYMGRVVMICPFPGLDWNSTPLS